MHRLSKKQRIPKARAKSRKIKSAVRAIAFVALAVFIFSSCAGHKAIRFNDEIPELLSHTVEFPLAFEKRITDMETQPRSLVSIAAVGDLMLGSWIVNVVKRKGVDYPYDSTRMWLKSADFAIANLEAPLTDSGAVYENKTYTFKVPPYFARGIRNAGIDVVTLANNHILDFDCEGLENTIAALSENGVAHCGAGSDKAEACKPVILDQFGIRVAFIGFSMTFPKEFWASDTSCGTCYPTESQLKKSIRLAEEQADLTVVSFHWSAEKRTTPKEYQRYFAHLAIDSGADLVLGHHPHVLQGVEIYNGRLIAYSLGNYVFGSYSSNSRTSIVLQAMINPSGLLYARAIPISVLNTSVEFQPRPLRGAARQHVIDELNELSRHLNQDRDIFDKDGRVYPFRYAVR